MFRTISVSRMELCCLNFKTSFKCSTVWFLSGASYNPIPAQGGVEGICGNADCDVTNEFNQRGSINPYTGNEGGL